MVYRVPIFSHLKKVRIFKKFDKHAVPLIKNWVHFTCPSSICKKNVARAQSVTFSIDCAYLISFVTPSLKKGLA